MLECFAKKVTSLDSSRRASQKAQAITELRHEFDLDLLLNQTEMARSSFYYHKKQSKKPDKYQVKKELIKSIYHKHKGRYGYRRITDELQNKGIKINHKTVFRLMKLLGLKSIVRIKKYKSYKGEQGKIAPNILERNFKAEAPNKKWATDVTEFKVGGKEIVSFADY